MWSVFFKAPKMFELEEMSSGFHDVLLNKYNVSIENPDFWWC